MGRGPKRGAQRAKVSKHLRSNTKAKRFKNDNEAQARYKAKIAARRAKKMKKNRK